MSLERLQLILASGSSARKLMLENSGLKFEVVPTSIDEKNITEALFSKNYTPNEITMELSIHKALHISSKNKDSYVIGSDQTLILDRRIFSKAKNKNEAHEKLKILRGKTHTLISAVCVAKEGEIIFKTLDHAQLTMHEFSDDFLDNYIERATDTITSCVGAYAIEDIGAWLFSEIKGNHFTIMGMPLIPLLSFLQTQGFRP